MPREWSVVVFQEFRLLRSRTAALVTERKGLYRATFRFACGRSCGVSTCPLAISGPLDLSRSARVCVHTPIKLSCATCRAVKEIMASNKDCTRTYGCGFHGVVSLPVDVVGVISGLGGMGKATIWVWMAHRCMGLSLACLVCLYWRLRGWHLQPSHIFGFKNMLYESVPANMSPRGDEYGAIAKFSALQMFVKSALCWNREIFSLQK